MKPMDEATRLRGIANCRRILDYLDSGQTLTEQERAEYAAALAGPRNPKQPALPLGKPDGR